MKRRRKVRRKLVNGVGSDAFYAVLYNLVSDVVYDVVYYVAVPLPRLKRKRS